MNTSFLLHDIPEVPDSPVLMNKTAPVATMSPEDAAIILLYVQIRNHIQVILIPCILCVGLVGNIVNLAVFTRKRLLGGMDEIERSATAGLVALAVSDLLFCITGLCEMLISSATRLNASWIHIVMLYYRCLKPGFSSLFIFLSTWITVCISLERYFAVSHPFQARWFISVKRTILIHLCVTLISIIFNLPIFLKTEVIYHPDLEIYMLYPRLAFNTPKFDRIYSIIHCCVAIVIPVVILSLSNLRLMMEIYRSRKRGIADSNRYSTSKITITLATIVILFFCLVVPSMLAKFVDMYKPIPPHQPLSVEKRRLTLCITNLTQAINFSINFLLYCTICKHFRDTLGGSLCRRKSSSTSSSSRNTATTASQHRYHLVDLHI